MKEQYTNLGKVSVTPAGYWNRQKEYERIDVVTNITSNIAYIAKKDVPSGIDITNEEYWQRIGSGTYKDNGIIILGDRNLSTGELVVYTLDSAIASINDADKRPGLILGFYGSDYSDPNSPNAWMLYQYNSKDIEHFNDASYWISLYSVVNKFKGYFSTAAELNSAIAKPTVGDYAYVGPNMDEAILYVCTINGTWTNTNTKAIEFANVYECLLSKDFSNIGYNIEEEYADRAEKDSLGRVIHFTYVTKEGLSAFVVEKVLNAISEIQLPAGSVTLESLSQSLKDYIASGGNIQNMPDEEDLTSIGNNEDRVLKFKDKEYSPTNFSGRGRVYLRKNMIDGINVLEQYMINKPNTIYIIQYDYCLNDATIVIPDNCILKFEGGTINGGIINLNKKSWIDGIPNLTNLGINNGFMCFAEKQMGIDNNGIFIIFNNESYTISMTINASH